MGLIPEQSFTVRVPAWHREGIVLADYPGRDEAMRLSGHDFDVIETKIRVDYPNEVLAAMGEQVNANGGGFVKPTDEYKAHLHSKTGKLLHVSQDSFERIQNAVAYDIAEVILDEGFLYETGGTMDGGKLNYLTLLLPEPFYISGDTSAILPYCGMSWAHDGTASLKVRGTSVRQVCQNTVTASEAEAKRLGTDFVFRHTKNVHDRIAEAKKAIRGIREGVSVYVEAMEALTAIEVTPEQRDLFVSTIIGDVEWKNGRPDGLPVSQRKDTTSRVKTNIETERTKVLSLFMGQTIPEAHALTGYGLHLAGVEYFDHLRNFRSKDAYVKRTLLTDNPAKKALTKTITDIRDLVAA